MSMIWKPNGRTPRFISLTRVSSDPKFESTSHDTQHAGNLRCGAELGATLFAHYEETISGALYLAREETQRALDDLENDRADYLILYDMTRYGRSVRWQQEILHRIERAGKRIQFATFRLDYDEYENTLTMWSRNAFNNFGNASENERYAIRERTQRGVKRQLELGVMPKRSRVALGYGVVTKADVIRGEQTRDMLGKYFVKPDEAEPVRAIFEQIAQSGSLSTLSRYMIEHYPPSTYGRYWRRACLANIIRNPIYKGKAAYGKRRSFTDESRIERGMKMQYTKPRPPEQWIYVDCPAIVPEELWEAANRRLDEGRERRSGPRPRRYMLTSLLRCGECGAHMVGSWKTSRVHPEGIFNYNCNRRYREDIESLGRKCCGNSGYFPAAVIEDMVITALEALLRDPGIVDAARHQQRSRKKTVTVEQKIERLNQALSEMNKRERAIAEKQIQAFTQGRSGTVYDEMLNALEIERRQLEQELKTLQPLPSTPPETTWNEIDARGIIRVLRSKEAPPHEKSAVLEVLIDHVVFVSQDHVKVLLRSQNRLARFWIENQNGKIVGAFEG